MITVLYVDDEPALLDIAKLFLEKTSEFKVLTAESALEGLEIIKTHKPQAIVSDYLMPGMDGMAFLKEVRKTSSVPFIMFTGRGSEIVAMEATNNGADYYIQKGADPRALFAELTYKLRLSLSDRRTETEEQRAKKTIRTLIDKTYDAVIIHSPDGHIVDVNDKMLKLFHLTRSQALKMTISDLTGPKAPTEVRSGIIDKVLAGEDQFLVWQARRPDDGLIFPIEKFLTRINFGQNMFILCNIREVSSTDKSRDDETAINFAVDHTREGIICTDQEGQVVFINKTWLDRLGVVRSEITGHHVSRLDPSMNLERWKEFLEKISDEVGITLNTSHRRSDGSDIPVEMTSYRYTDGPKIFICSFIRE